MPHLRSSGNKDPHKKEERPKKKTKKTHKKLNMQLIKNRGKSLRYKRKQTRQSREEK